MTLIHILATLYADDTTRAIIWHTLTTLHLDGLTAHLIHLAGLHLWEDWSISR